MCWSSRPSVHYTSASMTTIYDSNYLQLCPFFYEGCSAEMHTCVHELGHTSTVCGNCGCCWVASVVSDSVLPYRRQPTRLPCPWDSPGKNAWKWKVKLKWLRCVRLFEPPWTAAHQAPPSLRSPGESTGVGAIAFSVCGNHPNATQSGTERRYSSLSFFSSNCFFLGYSRPCAFLCEF